ncbi:Cationic amino acid transporter 1 [Hibiscus syriacus]|uniref:Cationic amino acid transporter 1 n=1 Tax=Hibiscus syriacus TaxID=106335 RepID=A0A6A2WA96_HIBSY|nr:Cationic amino acid transporter 1 [Hibiscus syriacus]
MLSVFCYTEFAVEIPVAGGSFAYLRVELGDFMAFVAAGNILLEYVIAGAAVARSWTSYFATLCNHNSDDFLIIVHSMPKDYGKLDPIAVVVVIVICILAVHRTKGSSRFNYVASVVHVLVILFVIIAGFTKAHTKYYNDFATFGIHGIFKSSAVLFFAYVGFDAVSTTAEETKNPAHDIPNPYRPQWHDYSPTRRRRRLSSISHAYCSNPHDATMASTSPSKDRDADLRRHRHAYCHRDHRFLYRSRDSLRGYYVSGETSTADRNKLIAFIALILASSTATAAYWGLSDNNDWIAYVISIPICFLATAGIAVLVPQARKPKVWGVPMVPWLPSQSIAINIFLLESIDAASFKRFGMWTCVLLYYFFFGLHASYDTAKESGENKIGEGWKEVEEGQSDSTITAAATAGVSLDQAK